MDNIFCLNCGKKIKKPIYNADQYGQFVICPYCKSSFDTSEYESGNPVWVWDEGQEAVILEVLKDKSVMVEMSDGRTCCVSYMFYY